MRTAILTLLLFVCSACLADDRPQMKCRAAGERWFVCDAINVPKAIEPSWRVYSSPLSYGGRGHSLSFPTPEQWSVVELTFDAGDDHFVISVEVRRHAGKVWFQHPKSAVTRNVQ